MIFEQPIFVTTFSFILILSFYFFSLLLWFLCQYSIFFVKFWLSQKLSYTPYGHNYKQKLHFGFIQLMIYVVFIIDHIHHLMNEFKMLIFAYNSDQMM